MDKNNLLLNRSDFKNVVFKRDNHKCVVCGKAAVDAHHLIERKLWNDGGYYIDNGVSLCEECHKMAEKCLISVEELRELAGITNIVLPHGFDSNKVYNKWGKEKPFPTREAGFYIVRDKNRQLVAEFKHDIHVATQDDDDNCIIDGYEVGKEWVCEEWWLIPGEQYCYNDEDFEYIDTKKLF
jgi:hypothetical protein